MTVLDLVRGAGVTDLVIYAIWGVLLVLGSSRLPRLWRTGCLRGMSGTPSWWAYGHAAWRAWVRSLHLWIVAGWFGTAALACPRPALVPLIAMFEIVMFAAIAVMAFNRPRFLVAPALRGQRGLLAEWLRR